MLVAATALEMVSFLAGRGFSDSFLEEIGSAGLHPSENDATVAVVQKRVPRMSRFCSVANTSASRIGPCSLQSLIAKLINDVYRAGTRERNQMAGRTNICRGRLTRSQVR